MVDKSGANQFGFGQIDQIQKIETLGEGAYGVVYKGVY
jgi:hypothetical protein